MLLTISFENDKIENGPFFGHFGKARTSNAKNVRKSSLIDNTLKSINRVYNFPAFDPCKKRLSRHLVIDK